MTARRALLSVIVLVALSAAVVFGAHQLVTPKESGLAGMMPSGALLYIESPDFQSLLNDWSSSSEKRAWLTSDDYAVFSRSRLFGRLSQAQSEFAATAGLPPDMQLLTEVAGRQSAFAWYDIGKLEFLYIARLPSTRFDQSALWQSRSKFQQRQSNKLDFYVRTDPESKRTVSFAQFDDWIVLGTREDLVANALSLIGGAQIQSLRNESWYADSIDSAKTPGDLRMVLNLEKLVPSPYFRSYWVQQNITEMKQYRAAISDLYRSKQAYREERLLLPRNNTSDAASSGDISALAAAVPADTGFYKAVSEPSMQTTMQALRDKLLERQPFIAANNRYAPTVTPPDQGAGQASDLETSIDRAPAVEKESDPWKPLQSALDTAHVDGMLEVESSAQQEDGVFTQFHSAVVLSASHDWDLDQLKLTLSSGLEPQTSTSRMGLGWIQKNGYAELDGLLPLQLATQGKYLILANDPALLRAVQGRIKSQSATTGPIIYAAGFNHTQESGSFRRITSLIDRASMRGNSEDAAAASGSGQSPAFFSGNVASISRVFSDVASESVVVRNAGRTVAQTVTYQWK